MRVRTKLCVKERITDRLRVRVRVIVMVSVSVSHRKD